MNYDEFEEINSSLYSIEEEFLKGEITLQEYLKRNGEIFEYEERKGKVFCNFSEFERYLTKIAQRGTTIDRALAQITIKHERDHARVVEKYGLKVKYVVKGLKDGGFLGTINWIFSKLFLETPNWAASVDIYDPNEAIQNWSRERYIQFIKEVCSATDNPSSSDQKTLELIERFSVDGA